MENPSPVLSYIWKCMKWSCAKWSYVKWAWLMYEMAMAHARTSHVYRFRIIPREIPRERVEGKSEPRSLIYTCVYIHM